MSSPLSHPPLKFNRLLRRAVIWPVVLSVLVALFFLWQVESLRRSAQWVDHTDRVIGQAHYLQKLMLDAESGVRGYVINRNVSFLEPYTDALPAIPSQVKVLYELVADNPQQQRLLSEIDTTIQSWLVIGQRSIERVKKGQSMQEAAPNHRGKERMDDFRVQVGEFIRIEENLRNSRVSRSDRVAGLAVMSGISVGLLLAIFLILSTRRSLISLSQTHAAALRSAESKAAEVEESREWFSRTLASIGDAVVVVDENSRVAFVNPVAESLTGWMLDEARGRHLSEVFRIINEQTREPAFNPVERVLREGIVVGLANHTVLIRRDGQEFPIEDSAAPIRLSHGHIRGVVLVFRDVTEKHLADDALRNSEYRFRNLAAELQQAVRARDDFLSIASHELKTPLTTLKLQLQMNLRLIQPENGVAPSLDKLKKFVALCYEQSKRLNTLIEDLLDVTRIQQGKLTLHFEAVDLAQLVKEQIEQFSDQIRLAGCSIEFSGDEAVLAHGDRFRLEQVVINLLTNAMKYGAGKPIRITAELEGDWAKLLVKDSGIGIAKANQSLIFERFERAIDSNNISGLGLGLYIVRQIVSAHGGSIEVDSDVGLGASFIVKIPVAKV